MTVASKAAPARVPRSAIRLEPVAGWSVGQKVGQLRAVPVSLGPGEAGAVALLYGADFDVDPFTEMFFFPTDTLKLALYSLGGKLLWREDLGRGVVPGVWFCPVLAFDLDGDGTDELWLVDNVNADHPLGLSGYRLARLDARTGERTGEWPWPNHGTNAQSLSHLFRNFLVGGSAGGEPVLVSAQGTYGAMFLQGHSAAPGGGLDGRWQVEIPKDSPGARGSHMCALADLDGDGVQEVLWGERPIALDTGRELFCADRDSYRGHSDVAQPWLDRRDGSAHVYVCRESDAQARPRVLCYDARGGREWGDVEHGHMDIGWVARLGLPDAEYAAMAIRIRQKFCGPDGRWHTGTEQFAWEARTGSPITLPFDAYKTIPVDVDGDGVSELVRGAPGGDGAVWRATGEPIGSVGGAARAGLRRTRRA
ncbi:MAG TPA: hypothetical protein VFX49_09920 [Chloroflexota bacterium]|nr:hypothetical protein [Chloroflexota bacterium]